MIAHDTLSQLVSVLTESLGLAPDVAAGLRADSGLFGQLPELDSMAVATLLTAIEDHFGILIDDEDVTADLFETVGALAAHIDRLRTKQARSHRATA
ncbi:acyl carrier protein [Thermaurantiacus sp.]